MVERITKNPLEIVPSNGDVLRVNPNGAKITLTLDNTPILVSVVRGDGKQGETHPCTPIFGPDRNNMYGLSQHGNMRNELCQIFKDDKGEVIVTHEITDAKDRYPAGIRVEQKLQITDGTFSLTMTHTNNGNEKAPVNSGEHCYFNAPQGYKGTKINGIDVSDLVVKTGVIKLLTSNTIQIPGLPDLTLNQTGFNYAVLWVSQNEKGQLDQNYVCIEPVEGDPFGDYFGSEKSLIHPQESRTSYFELAIKRNQ